MNTGNHKSVPDALQTVAQLAVEHRGALAVFTKYDIDYCCGGHRTLEEACMRIGLDPEMIREEIFRSMDESTGFPLRPQNWSSSFLIDFIIQNHHVYTRQALNDIVPFLDKVCDAHGSEHEELFNIREFFIDLTEELLNHMDREEMVLFPAIKHLEKQDTGDHPLMPALQPSLQAMEHDHTVAGDLVKRIRTLSKNYVPPEYACPTFRITYQKLSEIDADLMQHIHLENNILFPRLKDSTA